MDLRHSEWKQLEFEFERNNLKVTWEMAQRNRLGIDLSSNGDKQVENKFERW